MGRRNGEVEPFAGFCLETKTMDRESNYAQMKRSGDEGCA